MNFLWDKVTEWLKELLIGSIMSNLTGLFDNVNRQVAGIADNVGTTPQAWNGGVFGMIRNLSDNVILPIAGVILALVATLELIQMIVDRNNMHDMDTFMLAKWVFKTACAVVIVTNTWNIVMAVFDVAQSVVSRASGLVIADTDIRIDSVIVGLEAKLAEMELGALFGLWVQSMFVGFTMICSANSNCASPSDTGRSERACPPVSLFSVTKLRTRASNCNKRREFVIAERLLPTFSAIFS